MTIFDEVRAKGAKFRLTEELLYAEVMREMESGLRRDGLWAKALTESNFNESEAKAKYIKLRIQSLRDELVVAQAEVKGRVSAKTVTPPVVNIPQTNLHTDNEYECNNCDYHGKLLVVYRHRLLYLSGIFYLIFMASYLIAISISFKSLDNTFLAVFAISLPLMYLSYKSFPKRFKYTFCPRCGNRGEPVKVL
jgi:hypothetical protein